MEWQLEQFLSERVERGRTLLAESEEHRGSTDLQVCVGSGAGGAARAAAGQCRGGSQQTACQHCHNLLALIWVLAQSLCPAEVC